MWTIVNDTTVYKNVSERVTRSLKVFNKKRLMSEKQLKDRRFDLKKAFNLEKLYFLPKIQKRLFNVPNRVAISNCTTPDQKVSEFPDSHQ